MPEYDNIISLRELPLQITACFVYPSVSLVSSALDEERI